MKKVICTGMMLCAVTQALAASGKQPLAFFSKTTFPKTTDGGTTTFLYTLINNTPVTLPLTISAPTVSSGSISLSSSTCGATLAASAKCTLNYLFTAPTNSSSTPLNITGSFQVAYNGRYPLIDNTIRFIVPEDAPAFTEQPDFSPAITVPSSGTYKLRYAVKNNLSTTITSVSFSPTVSSGSIASSGGTCGTSIAGGASCTKTFLFTAPANLGSTDTSVTGTMTFNYTDTGGAQTLAGDALAFSITPAPKPSIAISEHSLMFPNLDFGNSSSYTGKITISNNSTANIVSISRSVPSGITFVSTTCSFPLAPSDTCTQTYSSPIPITADSTATIQLTPNSADTAGNTVNVPISSLGIVALAPPTDSSVGLTVVNGCADTTNDGGLMMVTNNSSENISNITIDSSDLSGATITNPTFSPNNNVYCEGQTLPPNGYCEFRVSSSTNTTGEIDIYGQFVSSLLTTHHYELQTKVIASASSLPAPTVGTAFVSDTSCNLVETWTSVSVTPSLNTWSYAASQCAALTNPEQNWRLPDVGPNPVGQLDDDGDPLTGEFAVFQGVDSGEVWLSPSPTPSQNAWLARAPNMYLEQTGGGTVAGNYNAYCVRAYTTNTNGS